MFEYICVGINTSKNSSSGWWRTFQDEKLNQSSISICMSNWWDQKSLYLHLHAVKKNMMHLCERENENKLILPKKNKQFIKHIILYIFFLFWIKKT